MAVSSTAFAVDLTAAYARHPAARKRYARAGPSPYAFGRGSDPFTSQ